MLALVLALVISTDVDQLGSTDWESREQAEQRLQAWGAAAWPALLDARHNSHCPEVRQRSGRLLVPYTRRVDDQRARRLLRDRWPLTVSQSVGLFLDHDLRRDVARLVPAT